MGLAVLHNFGADFFCVFVSGFHLPEKRNVQTFFGQVLVRGFLRRCLRPFLRRFLAPQNPPPQIFAQIFMQILGTRCASAALELIFLRRFGA